MRIVLFDTQDRHTLFPFTATRPVADLLMGMLTIREKWQHFTSQNCEVLTENYLQEERLTHSDDTLYINAHLYFTKDIANQIMSLQKETALCQQSDLLAFRTHADVTYPITQQQWKQLNIQDTDLSAKLIKYPWELLEWNGEAIASDFEMLTYNRKSAVISNTNQIQGREQIFIEPGVELSFATLNATYGPIYIGKNAAIMEGVCIRGPVAILNSTTVKMGTTIYGGTTIGANCLVGGEIKQSIMMPFSNKAHHGYLGNAIIGAWCNLGAGTSCSNIKNNAGDIKVYNPLLDTWNNARQKCGVFMGDYSRSAIHTAFNSGSLVGVGTNVLLNRLSDKYIKSFIWNVETGERYQWEKLCEDINAWMLLKNMSLTTHQKNILHHLYNTERL